MTIVYQAQVDVENSIKARIVSKCLLLSRYEHIPSIKSPVNLFYGYIKTTLWHTKTL